MKEEKDLLKTNETVPEVEREDNGENLEGYSYCDSHGQRCSNDCFGTPALSHLN